MGTDVERDYRLFEKLAGVRGDVAEAKRRTKGERRRLARTEAR